MGLLRSFSVMAFAAGLTGCAAQAARLLGDDPQGNPDASFITAPEDEYFWVTPVPSGHRGVPPPEMQILKDGVWVSEGWLEVEFQCYSPKDAPAKQVEDPILPEGPDEKPVFVHGGRRYRLSCDPKRIGRFEFTEEAAAGK